MATRVPFIALLFARILLRETAVTTTVSSSALFHHSDMDDLLFLDSLLFDDAVWHVIECARRCSDESTCVAFTFTSTGSCRGHNATVTSAGFNTATSSGAKTFAKATTGDNQELGGLADVVFILDSSRSVRSDNFQLVLQFVSDLVGHLNVGWDLVRVGVVKFANDAYIEFLLNELSDTDSVQQAIMNIQSVVGRSNTGAALRYAREYLFNTTSGDRLEFPNIAVLITDGAFNNTQNTLSQAEKLRDSGVEVFCLGVSSETLDVESLREFASDPDDQHVVVVPDFSSLGNITSTVLALITPAMMLPGSGG